MSLNLSAGGFAEATPDDLLISSESDALDDRFADVGRLDAAGGCDGSGVEPRADWSRRAQQLLQHGRRTAYLGADQGIQIGRETLRTLPSTCDTSCSWIAIAARLRSSPSGSPKRADPSCPSWTMLPSES